MSGHLELIWNEDPRSIGIFEGEMKYKPFIMLNFKFLGYISDVSHAYRGYKLLIQTAGGNDFAITVSEREIQGFPSFISTVRAKTHGEVIQHACFEPSLWTDMIPKVMLDFP